jgi:tryptophan halogenase|tara:strand:+ start:557 stop:2053 length:1497 start_codon:yes stop_codon:yes gene_type:complete
MNVVIVGGGSAGWMAAAAMLREVEHAQITLIDKEVPVPLGVGEATLLGFERFMRERCGFDSNEYLKALDVGLKAGILFPNWGYEGSAIWHPFYFLNYPFISEGQPPIPMTDAWSNAKDVDFKKLLVLYQASMSNIVDKNQLDGGYALHIDCIKLIEYIKSKILNDITFINSEVKEIKKHRNGNISSLKLENGRTISGDLFLDCTGFKSLLRDKRDRVDLTDRLYVDTAVAGPVEYQDRVSEFKPYTTCTAVDPGWIWNTPLQSRIGTGLVFNRTITPPEEAANFFCDHWNGRITPDDLKIIDWTPYYDKNMWEGNVVSIGLSAGFLEPLESTGLALIMESIATLNKLLNSGFYNEHDINYFNNRMVFSFEQCIDFVNAHYSKSTIQSPFWKYVRQNYKMSAAQEFYLKNMSSDDKSISGGKGFVFGAANWVHWLIQMGYDINPKKFIQIENIDTFLEHLIDCEDRKLESGVDLFNNADFADNFLQLKKPWSSSYEFYQ